MAFDKQAVIDQLSGLTVLELVELVDGLKETWGVEAAAAMPAGMMMAGRWCRRCRGADRVHRLHPERR